MEIEVNLDGDRSPLQQYLISNGYKILNTVFYSDGIGIHYGIVTMNNGFEIKSYLKAVKGIDEEQDILDILIYGAKFYPEAFAQFIS